MFPLYHWLCSLLFCLKRGYCHDQRRFKPIITSLISKAHLLLFQFQLETAPKIGSNSVKKIRRRCIVLSFFLSVFFLLLSNHSIAFELAWNWIEQAIDPDTSVCLVVHKVVLIYRLVALLSDRWFLYVPITHQCPSIIFSVFAIDQRKFFPCLSFSFSLPFPFSLSLSLLLFLVSLCRD